MKLEDGSKNTRRIFGRTLKLKWVSQSVKVLVTQSCQTLCNAVDCSPLGSSVHGILQERILEGVAIPFFRGSSWPRDRTWVSTITGSFLTIWTIRGSLAAAKSFQSFPTLCDPIDCSPPGSAEPGILQARTLEWVAISFSNAWKWKVKVKSLSHVQLFATPWTAASQAPPSMGFSRQEYWSGVPLPSLRETLGDLKTSTWSRTSSQEIWVSGCQLGALRFGQQKF